MKIYIASKYIEHKHINKTIYQKLLSNGFDAFLPESINIIGETIDEMRQIAFKCYNEIDSCNIMLVVSPFGDSVSAEIGYVISRKRNLSNINIILFRYTNKCKEHEDKEAMIVPFYDYVIDSTVYDNIDDALESLIILLNSISRKI